LMCFDLLEVGKGTNREKKLNGKHQSFRDYGQGREQREKKAKKFLGMNS